MPNIPPNQSSTSNAGPLEPDLLPEITLETEDRGSATPELSTIMDFRRDATTVSSVSTDNYMNQRQMLHLKRQFTPQLVNLIVETDFDYGIDSKVDEFILYQMEQNALITKSWLNEIFVEYYNKPAILIGLLRVISRLPYAYAFPENYIMATAALVHNNVEVKECAVRAFENWGNLQSLRVLETVEVSPLWFQDYVNRIVEGLRKEYNVSIS